MAMGIWLPGGGGGGASSDDCTLMRAAVPAGMKAVTADSDDEAMEGTLNPDTTLADSQALSGQTFLKWNPQTKLFERHTGSMANRGAVNQSLAINGSYTIPAGYHNGSGKVSQSVKTKGAQTFTPGTSNQTIAASQWLTGVQTILGDANLKPENIREGVTIFGKKGTVIEYKSPATIDYRPKMGNSGGNGYSGVSSSSADSSATLYVDPNTSNPWALALLNNGTALNLTGWNYINVKEFVYLGYYNGTSLEAYLGVSKNSNLGGFTFDVVDKITFSREQNPSKNRDVKLNVSSLSGTYFLYVGLKITKGTTASNPDNSYIEVSELSLSTQ